MLMFCNPKKPGQPTFTLSALFRRPDFGAKSCWRVVRGACLRGQPSIHGPRRGGQVMNIAAIKRPVICGRAALRRDKSAVSSTL